MSKAAIRKREAEELARKHAEWESAILDEFWPEDDGLATPTV